MGVRVPGFGGGYARVYADEDEEEAGDDCVGEGREVGVFGWVGVF